MLGKHLIIVHVKRFLSNLFCSGVSLALKLQPWPLWTHPVPSSLRALAHALSLPTLFLPLVFFHSVLAKLTFQLKCFTFRLPVPSPYSVPSSYLSQFVITYLFVYILTVDLSHRIVNSQRGNMLVLFEIERRVPLPPPTSSIAKLLLPFCLAVSLEIHIFFNK